MKDSYTVIPLDMPLRRDFLMQVFRTAGAVSLTGFLTACGGDDDSSMPTDPTDPTIPVDPTDPVDPPAQPFNAFAQFSELQPVDANGVMLPKGFSSKILAESGKVVEGTTYTWHIAPDGGACFPTEDGGWVYTSNAERSAPLGGASALKFDKTGKLIDAYSILKNTSGNCAGGPTPWNTWLSCEEFVLTRQLAGQVWECDPYQPESDDRPSRALPALGKFAHEAVCVDPVNRVFYMTEDQGPSANANGGRIYRYVCSDADWPVGADRPLQLATGQLQVLQIDGIPADGNASAADYASFVGFGKPAVSTDWIPAYSPEDSQAHVREELGALGVKPPGNYFQKAEGIWFFDGIVFFVTSTNSRIWAYDVGNRTVEVIFDGTIAPDSTHTINSPDNITVSPSGELLATEDGGNREIGVVRADGTSQVVLRMIGHDGSETTGVAVSPDGTHMYFSSQRGALGAPEHGMTFAVKLPTKVVL